MQSFQWCALLLFAKAMKSKTISAQANFFKFEIAQVGALSSLSGALSLLVIAR
jgi:hypothetical protein